MRHMAPTKRLYVAIFLDEASKEALLRAVPPKHVNVYGEHMTLAFGRHMQEIYPLGLEVELEVAAIFEDERGQAVTIEKTDLFRSLLWEQQSPHITLSCGIGVKPNYSNELIKGTAKTLYTLGHGPKLKGILDYFPRTPKEAVIDQVPTDPVGSRTGDAEKTA